MAKKLAILGAGESGVGTAVLAQQQGYEVFVSDKGSISEDYQQELMTLGVDWEGGDHTEARILDADEVVKSPGIPETAPLVMKLNEQGTPVISEIEFAARFTKSQIVAITGSNGKTTTTSLTYHVMKEGGLDVAMGGNIGKSFARLVAEKNYDYYVLELSSFQLDGIKEFKPDVAVLLNITPDHLDRYDYKFENYIASKFRITMNMDDHGHFIYCADDEVITDWMANANISANQIPFSNKPLGEDKEGAWIENEELHFYIKKNPFEMYIYDLALQGQHNAYNTMAAGVVARLFDLREDTIRESLQSFQALEHRLEFVTRVHGIEFVNDSKATNVNSSWYALETMDKPVVWIAGGVDKGNDYESLIPLVKEKVKMIVCMGDDNRHIHEAFSKHVDMIVNTHSADEAVKAGYQFAEKGDVVLLSPACASFDLFENYEDRGRQFKRAVRAL